MPTFEGAVSATAGVPAVSLKANPRLVHIRRPSPDPELASESADRHRAINMSSADPKEKPPAAEAEPSVLETVATMPWLGQDREGKVSAATTGSSAPVSGAAAGSSGAKEVVAAAVAELNRKAQRRM